MSGDEGFVEASDPAVYLPGLQQRPLRPFTVSTLQRTGHFSQYRDQFLEYRTGRFLDQSFRVYREQVVDEQSQTTARQGVEKAVRRDGCIRRLQDDDQDRRDRCLIHQDRSPAEEHRRRHREEDDERDLEGARTDQEHKDIGDHEPHSYAEDQLDRAAAPVAERHAETDYRRNRSEEGLLVTQQNLSQQVRSAGRHRRLHHRPRTRFKPVVTSR